MSYIQNWQRGASRVSAATHSFVLSKGSEKEHVLGSLESHLAGFPVNYLLIALRSRDA